MRLQRWSWARLLSPSHSALLKWQLQKNSPATSEPSWAVPLRRYACLAFLKPGESHTVVTDRQDVCEVQVQIWRGTVVCKVASAGDVCNICQEEVKEKTSLEMSEEYAGVLGNTVCWACSSTWPRPNADLIVNRTVPLTLSTLRNLYDQAYL